MSILENSMELSDSTPRAAKRHKIAVACDPCRRRKVRCDGIQPTCTQCVTGRKRYTCTYEDRFPEPQRTNVEGIGPLLARIGRAEDSRHVENDLAFTNTLQTPADTLVAASEYSDANLARPEVQDVIFGASSSTTFMHQLSSNQHRHTHDFVPKETHHVPAKLKPLVVKAAVLPRRRVADELIKTYWTFVHPLFPILHRPTFVRSYEKLWTSQPDEESKTDDSRRDFEEALFLSTLNIVFALSTRFCNSIPEPEKGTMVSEFYNMSKQTFQYDALDCTSFPVLQMLLLQAVHLQSTTEVTRCWNLLGVATRMAQSLGLHSEQTYQSQKTVYSREMGKRLWHSCLVLDRLAAATFGWPMMIRSGHSILLPMLSDETLSVQDKETPSSVRTTCELSIFRCNCDLFDVVGEILSALYCDNGALKSVESSRDQRSRSLSHIASLNGRLEAFLVSIPDHIRDFIEGRGRIAADDISVLNEHAVSCRFLYTRILLLRPALLLLPSSSDSTDEEYIPYEDRQVIHNVELCTTTCERLLNILYNSLDSSFRVADWHVVYMTFTAATSMLAIKRYASTRQPVLVSSIDVCIQKSYHILQYMESSVPISTQSLHSLQLLDRHINESVGGRRSIAEQNFTPVMGQMTDMTSIEDFDDFDWLANPSAMLSQQMLGSEWLGDSGAWFNQ
ncbi:hypothetical protein E4T43_07757 [Aureobasidium subglaciale]|nr:hypothetical protein E4T43_07757 [Aureobasidium subglaciale]